MKGTLRTVLAVLGVLFSLLLVVVLAGEVLVNRFMPKMVTFDPATYKGKTGQIVTPLKGDVSLNLLKSGEDTRFELVEIKGQDGKFVVPTGDYRVMSCDQAIVRDGTTWDISHNALPSSQKLAVTPGSKSELNIGPPYTASIKVDSIHNKKLNLSLAITGHSGEKCSIVNQSTSKAPGFQILSKSGDVLQEGTFEYG